MIIVCYFILCIISYRIIPERKQMLAALSTALLMSVLAYYLTEKNQYDLIVHRGLFETMQDGGLSAAMAYSVVDRSPLFVWLVYGLSYLEDNRFLSAIPTFVGYFILVYFLVQTSKIYRINKQKQIVFLLFLLFVLPWQDYSAGIRGVLAYSLCSLGVYLEFRKHEKLLGFTFYLFPIFIHQASIVFLLLRLLIYWIKIFPSSKKFIYILCLLIGSMTEFMGPLIESFANLTGLRILAIVSDSFNSYTGKDAELYEVSIVVLRCFSVLMIYFATRKFSLYNIVANSESNIFDIYTMLMLLSVGFVWQYDIVCRYTVACIILSPLILYRCNQKYITIIIVFAILNLIRYYDSYYSKWEILFQ